MKNPLEVDLLKCEEFYCSELLHRGINCDTKEEEYIESEEFMI